MSTNMKRRVFLKGTMAASTLGIAVGAGLLAPQAVLASWPKTAFESKTVNEALTAALGSTNASPSDDVKIKAPDIAENGAVVPVRISTGIDNVESITLLAEANASPLLATFVLGASSKAFISTRIKMGKTGNIIAIVQAGGKLYKAHKSVKVTIGGCGG